MTKEIQQSMMDWCNKGNPSADYSAAKQSRKMMKEFRNYLGEQCDFCPVSDTVSTSDKTITGRDKTNTKPKYRVIFTSGASESNCSMFSMVVAKSITSSHYKPHVVLSSIEHKSLISMAESYESRGLIEVTYVQPTISGHIRPDDVENAIQQSTCLVCVMHANNETGAINDVYTIGQRCSKYGVIYHCDTVQAFGKYPISCGGANKCVTIDSFCISFHKLHGPPGVGCLIVRDEVMQNLAPIIFGSQNDGLRGGTENVPGIGASFTAIKYTLTNRLTKNASMLKIKKYIVNELSKFLPACQYTQYTSKLNTLKRPLEIVFLSGVTEYYLPNTILLSIVKPSQPYICNQEIKTELAKRGIVISVGSACNTASPKASHVLYAMKANEYIRKGALRISIGDSTTIDDAKKFVSEFISVVTDKIK